MKHSSACEIVLVARFLRPVIFATLLILHVESSSAAVPTQITYQGQLKSSGKLFNGPAQMKFAVVDGNASLWSNDSTSVGGAEPIGSVNVTVTDGVFTVHLGESPMKPLTRAVFSGSSTAKLRVWVNTGGAFEALTSDQALSSVPYSLQNEGASSGGGWTESGGDVYREGGSVGIGTAAPRDKLNVDGGRISVSQNIGANSGIDWLALRSNRPYDDYGGLNSKYAEIYLVTPGTQTTGETDFHSTGDVRIAIKGRYDNILRDHLTVRWNGNVGIGTSTPGRRLTVNNDQIGGAYVADFNKAQSGPGFIGLNGGSSGGRTYLQFDSDNFGIYTSNNAQTSWYHLDLDGTAGVMSFNGQISTKVLEITGGSDLAEPFDVTSAVPEVTPREGMVVAIDSSRPGGLLLAANPYDAGVAGVISGANGLAPGLVMKANGDAATDGKHPVALSGRVWCWVDASYGAVHPGDLLTTSTTPGMAMVARDPARRQGAVLGKAMTSLKTGRGLVLILVTLQ